MKRWLPLLMLLLCLAIARPAAAHDFRPAYLELRQTAADTFDVVWKIPFLSGVRPTLYLTMPEGTEILAERGGVNADNGYIERWSIRRKGGLAGGTFHISGLAGPQIDVLARIEYANGAVQTTRITRDDPILRVEAAPSAWRVSQAYLILGVEHILTGIDHLLYILAMLLLVKGWKRILATMTAFTLTHSITLSAAALGYVNVPGPPVEAMIALSIVFVAREGILARRGKAGLTQKYPWVIAFTFGLLHGFGFAGALNEVGLPDHAIAAALLSFNVGVEIGQLLFVAAVLGVMALVTRLPKQRLAWTGRVAPYAIGSMAMFWVIDRVGGFFS